MLTAKKQRKSKQQKNDTPKSQFAQLQDAIKRQQTRNQRLQADLQVLAERYQQQILPEERRLALPIKLLLQRLIDLFPRKNLAQWQRSEMMDWIMEELEQLRMLDPQAADEVITEYQAMLAEHFKLTPEELEDIEAEAEREDAAAMEDDDEFEDLFEELFNKFNGQDQDSFQSGRFDEAESADTTNAAARPPADGLSPQNWIKNLFRRTARVLHPDREQDPQLREQKHHLMAALVDARDRGDTMAMLRLFNDHVTGAEADFAADEYPALITLLQQQLCDLRAGEHDIIHASPFHHFLYRNLFSRQKAAQERKISAYLAGMESELEQRFDQAQAMRSVKSLKEALLSRRDAGYGIEDWF